MTNSGWRPNPAVLAALILAAGAIAVSLSTLVVTAASRSFDDESSGVIAKVTVNSTGNSDDGDCEGPPNDNTVGGDCTLIEAINDANAGLADVINFQPSIFSVIHPAVINIDTCLPAITRSGVTIDSGNAGVILDGDADIGSPITCKAAIVVDSSEGGFDFTITGGNNLTIRDFDGHGVAINCSPAEPPRYLGTVSITGVNFANLTGQDIFIHCPTPTPTATATPTRTRSPTATATPTRTPTPVSPEDCDVIFASLPFEVDEFCGVVTSIQRVVTIPASGPWQAVDAPPGGEFALVFMTVLNFSATPDDPTEFSFRLRDSKSRRFTMDFENEIAIHLTAQSYFGRSGVLDTVQPGLAKEMIFVLEVPTSATGLTVERCPAEGCAPPGIPTPSPTVTATPSPTASPTQTPMPTLTLTQPAPATSTPSPSSTPAPSKAGDANCDGSVDPRDAALILQLDAGLISNLPCSSNGDLNGDGRASSLDAAIVLQFIAGLIDHFPA